MDFFGQANELLSGRNKSLGWLLVSERAAAYVATLLALLRFRQNHELEPLHEDLLSELYGTGTGDTTQFAQDIRQLLDWELITQRIERERLRGYRDTRRRKFRYRLSDDAVTFLLWLEGRRQDDLNPVDADTRDLLSDMISSLREATRLLNACAAETVDYEQARALFHRLTKMTAATTAVADSLGDFNIRLLAFATGSYDIAQARNLIGELDHFLDSFVRRIHLLRGEITPELEKLRAQRLRTRWEACAQVLTQEAAATRTLMRIRIPDPFAELAAFADFYAPNGLLAQFTARVNSSALLVWQKLHAHLRELERRSHRLDDIRQRVTELALLPSDYVPRHWLVNILQPAHMRGDLNEWSEHIKATPPQPLWSKHRVRQDKPAWIEPRQPASGKPVQSLEEQRLAALAQWMRDHGVMPQADASPPLSSAAVVEHEDFARLLEIMRSGLLGDGRRLARIGAATELIAKTAHIANDDASLTFTNMIVKERKSDDRT